MASSTRQSLASASSALEPLLAKADLALVKQLFSAAEAIAGSAQLRSLLSDPSAEAAAKSSAVKAVFGKALSADVLGFLTTLVGLRWSKGSDLVSAIEDQAVAVIAHLAAVAKKLDALESELFAFQQAVETEAELQFALANKQASVEARMQLVTKLLGGRASTEAELLLTQAVAVARHERYSHVLERFGKLLAKTAKRLVAKVTVAQDLSAAQQDRLEKALAKQYDAQIKLNVEVDPSIIGGLRVQIADEIIDGSLVARLHQAKLQLA